MALLRHTTSGVQRMLETEHLVGRSPRAPLRLDSSYVSAQHASIRWTADGWELRDLGSRNGTWVDGNALKSGETIRLQRGCKVSFGHADQTWELIDDSPPQAQVVRLDGEGEPLLVEVNMLALPSADDPQVTILRMPDGSWKIEREDAMVPLVSEQVFEVGGKAFRFCAPGVMSGTSALEEPELTQAVHDLRLEFLVSRDEEHVQIFVGRGPEKIDLGSRAYHYLLLLLARHRLADATQGIADSACGWMYQEDLLDALRIGADRLNVDIFRIRKRFAALGIHDAAHIIERRPDSRQLRIGVATCLIQSL